ncbi:MULTISPECIES: AI-2E family transporter [unclassified Chelatococcus]|uniref:AI-2E family transporter n=1 Tax=unclassified Chelatococcus TaxID=2638111 RepID=UPI001BCB204E|nr:MULTISPECIES: AI-2E family transporter [unclassified Chelatococcus]MBS7698366.1 AI-2E family transporter [Chelatococcus sp. YT9]MBX3558867.1 AI-2E family transporter [Chelatococcus sp.]
MDILNNKDVSPAGTVPTATKPNLSETVVLPRDPVVVCLVILVTLALLTTAYVAADIILPIVLAFVLKLLFQPVMRLLEKLGLPRSVAALLLILAVFGAIVGIGAAISGPATAWASKFPEGVPRLQERLRFLDEPITTLRTFLHQADRIVQGGVGGGSPASTSAIASVLFSSTTHFAGSFFETILILFFLLMSGNTFLKRTVEILPSFKDKRQAVELSQRVEENISAYLLTITLMNVAVGLATGLAMWACGLGDPVLWGVVAFFLNYVPIMGPFFGVGIFLLAGLLILDPIWAALLPAALYLVIHVIEGEIVTPMLLARRFTLNPVLVIISLIFWFWMWGVPGAILAVPMLAIFKIVCDGVQPLAAIGHFLTGDE